MRKCTVKKPVPGSVQYCGTCTVPHSTPVVRGHGCRLIALERALEVPELAVAELDGIRVMDTPLPSPTNVTRTIRKNMVFFRPAPALDLGLRITFLLTSTHT
jgi:hypothetical protein